MKNYKTKLLLVKPEELVWPKGNIPFGDLVGLASIKNNAEYERSLRKLADKLPYKTSFWPSFGKYIEDWYKVEISEFKKQLIYCERGAYDTRESCKNLIDLSYHIFSIVSPAMTPAALKIAEDFDYYEDQRLLVWLRMSSGIYHMFQVNKYFGMRMLNSNITWMCEELVRMGVFKSTSDAFKNEIYIVKGLMLSGLPKDFTIELYQELKNT